MCCAPRAGLWRFIERNEDDGNPKFYPKDHCLFPSEIRLSQSLPTGDGDMSAARGDNNLAGSAIALSDTEPYSDLADRFCQLQTSNKGIPVAECGMQCEHDERVYRYVAFCTCTVPKVLCTVW